MLCTRACMTFSWMMSGDEDPAHALLLQTAQSGTKLVSCRQGMVVALFFHIHQITGKGSSRLLVRPRSGNAKDCLCHARPCGLTLVRINDS